MAIAMHEHDIDYQYAHNCKEGIGLGIEEALTCPPEVSPPNKDHPDPEEPPLVYRNHDTAEDNLDEVRQTYEEERGMGMRKVHSHGNNSNND